MELDNPQGTFSSILQLKLLKRISMIYNFCNKTIQGWKLPNSFAWSIVQLCNQYAEHHYATCHCAECLFVEWCYAEYHGAISKRYQKVD